MLTSRSSGLISPWTLGVSIGVVLIHVTIVGLLTPDRVVVVLGLEVVILLTLVLVFLYFYARSTFTKVYVAGLWLSLVFLPAVRLVSDIPVRVEDWLVFTSFAVVLATRVLSDKPVRFNRVDLILFLLIVYVAADTVRASVSGYDVTMKEFVDMALPAKFLAIVWVLKSLPFKSLWRALVWVVPLALLVQVGIVLLQAANPGEIASNSLWRIFAQGPGQFEALSYRPYGTLGNPSLLALVLSISILFLTTLHKRGSTLVLMLGLLGVTLSTSRTFMLLLPIALAVVYLFRSNLRWSILYVLVMLLTVPLVIALFLCFSSYGRGIVQFTLANFSSAEENYSLFYRLSMLDKVRAVLSEEPFFGYVTRSRLPPYVDVEYILTLLRYGLLGVGVVMLLYANVLLQARRRYSHLLLEDRLASAVGAMAFLYIACSVTQTPLMSQQMGSLLWVFVGALASLRTSLAVENRPKDEAAENKDSRPPSATSPVAGGRLIRDHWCMRRKD